MENPLECGKERVVFLPSSLKVVEDSTWELAGYPEQPFLFTFRIRKDLVRAHQVNR